jgi:hypothetical protein
MFSTAVNGRLKFNQTNKILPIAFKDYFQTSGIRAVAAASMQLNERDYKLAMAAERPNTSWATHVIGCPKCTARLTFYRGLAARIDACGFESYSLECEECGAPLTGIVDPFDDTLLLSEMAA